MTIKQIKIENIRNIELAEIDFSEQFNFIRGPNGSGKSTLLEAIYMLARGRSYRSNRFGSVVRHGCKQLTIFAQTTQKQRHKIGIQKSASQTTIKVDGTNVNKVSDIARITPLQIITPTSHEILERGPDYRKRFIEWGVFHVEHSYFELYKKFYRALKQRNALLRDQNTSVKNWNSTIGRIGEALNNIRVSYVNELRTKLLIEAQHLHLDSEISIAWKKGWEQSLTLEEALNRSLESDLKRGFTQVGPHRADLRIVSLDRVASQTLSRGQQKMLITALNLAQSALYSEKEGSTPILLFDDLVAELDTLNRERVLDRLKNIGQQVFITSIDPITAMQGVHYRDFKINNGKVCTQ